MIAALALGVFQLVASQPPAVGTALGGVGTRPVRTIVVDAGHGGPDHGMSGPVVGRNRLEEKTITLAVARVLGRLLEERGVRVVFTRTRDTLIALSDRGRIANEAQGSLFISIHVNAANPAWKSPSAARGFETYFLSDAKTEDEGRVEAMENASARFERDDDGAKADPLSLLLADLRQNEYLRESSALAETVQQFLGRMHPGPNRGVKQAGFRVLVTAYMPSVLVELGFGSNPAEARYLSDPAGQAALARAIAEGALAYLDAYDQRVRGARAGR
jgi:N-acetylmuramoyl-L-alanine amidase